MGNILIRDLEDDVIEKLKERARRSNRSLEAEARHILEQSTGEFSIEHAKTAAAKIRYKLEGRKHSNSVSLLSEDRESGARDKGEE